MATFGIDVSKWQKGINWDKVKNEGVKFAMLRGFSKTKDECFENFYKACKDRNIHVGCYIYVYATTVTQAKSYVQKFYDQCLKGKQFEYPIALDIEDITLLNKGKTTVTNIIKTMAEYLEDKGFYVVIYSSRSYFNTYMNDDQLTAYDKWIAEWSTQCKYDGDYGMWQFGGEINKLRSNKIAGKTVDQNYTYKDYPSIMKKQGLNGYKKTSSSGSYYPAFDSTSIVDGLKSICVDSSLENRKKIASANGINGYSGTYAENVKLLKLAKKGKLKKA
jgi:hypothetical protein